MHTGASTSNGLRGGSWRPTTTTPVEKGEAHCNELRENGVNVHHKREPTRLQLSYIPNDVTSPRDEVSPGSEDRETLDRAKRSRSKAVRSFADDLERDLDIALKNHATPCSSLSPTQPLVSQSQDDGQAFTRISIGTFMLSKTEVLGSLDGDRATPRVSNH